MWYVLGYLLLGWIVIYMTAAVHLMKAEFKGYAALEWWDEYHQREVYDVYYMMDFIVGSFIWPMRFVQFLAEIPWYYEQYELKTE